MSDSAEEHEEEVAAKTETQNGYEDEKQESSDHKSRSRSRSGSDGKRKIRSSKSKKRRRHRSKSSDSSSSSRSRSRSRSRRRKHRRRSRSRSRSRHRHRRSRSRSRGRDLLRGTSPKRRMYMSERDNPQASRCLGVFGMSLYTTERDLKDHFSKYGPIERVQLVFDHPTGRSRGFGFIYFENLEDAVEAKDKSTDIEMDGHRIRVDYSVTKRAHTPTPGQYMGARTSGYSRGGGYSGGYGGGRGGYGGYRGGYGGRYGGDYDRGYGGGYYGGSSPRDRYRRSPSYSPPRGGGHYDDYY